MQLDTQKQMKDKWYLIIVVCASPSSHSDGGGSFVQPKAEYVAYAFNSYSYSVDKVHITFLLPFVVLVHLCWLWPSLVWVGSAIFFTGMKKITQIVVNVCCSN